MASELVRLIYDENGINEYVFPIVFSISDSEPGMKATVISGIRGDGSLVIPSGKSSVEIKIRGKIIDSNGYSAITTKMNEMRTKVTTKSTTLKLQHFTGGSWIDDWNYNVRRITEISFLPSLRTNSQEYSISFLTI